MLVNKKTELSIFLFALFSLTPLAALAAAGNAIFVLGEVSVEDPGGEQHKIGKGSEINAGDVIVTGKRGQAQIRMSDGTLLAIRPDSRFRVDEYKYEQDSETDKSFYSLVKGGFRSITGKIGHEKKSSYGVKTVVGTIGIRGTDYSARLCDDNCNNADDGLYVSVMEGGVVLSNDSSQLDISPGEYGYMQDNLSEPVYLETAPGDLLFAQSTNTSSEENDSVAATTKTDENVDSGTSTTQNTTVAINSTSGNDLVNSVDAITVDGSADILDTLSSIDSIDNGITLPSSGTALYQVIASTAPTDGITTGVLNEINTALNVDFVSSTATASLAADFSSETWSANSVVAMPINSDGSFAGDLYVNITPTGLGASRTGNGTLDGNLSGLAEPTIGAPNNANFNYNMSDGLATVSGSVELSVSNTTP